MTQVIENLQHIRNFPGHPGRFWPAFLEFTTKLASARAGVLLVEGNEAGTWKQMCIWPTEENNDMKSAEILGVIERAAESSMTNGSAWECQTINGHTNGSMIVLALRLKLDEAERKHAIVFLLDQIYAETVEQTAQYLKLVADTPAIYLHGRAVQRTMNDIAQLSEALDLMVLLNAETRYMAVAMTFVNEVASRYRCARVSIGWLHNGYVRLQAVSHMERFEKEMDIVQMLERAMEEAFDQNEEIMLPPSGTRNTVVRDHETFSKEQQSEFMASIPIRLDDDPAGVLTCERTEGAFSETEIRGLRVICDQAARRLGDLKKNDRWFGARVLEDCRTGASRLLGVEHTLAKCIGLIISGAILFLLFGSLQYRVEAPFILRSDDVRFLPAPFEGYIDVVQVKVGDRVGEEELLLTLDTTDLLLKESAAIANHLRYSREAEKARSENELAEMKIALALAEQARAQLELVRYNLSRAEVRAPFSGIIVEGDLEELQGASVKKGDALFKVSRIEKMYADLEISERDIHEVSIGATGEITFVSQPQLTFPIEVEQINPVANAKKEEGNVFLVRSIFQEDIADWWRPGMSGLVKVNTGRRNVLWILTHRTIDFFRMRLWW